MYVKLHFEGRLCNPCSRGKAKSIKYYECVCVCVCVSVFLPKLFQIKISYFMGRIILPVEPLCLQYITTLPHGTISGERGGELLNLNCALSFAPQILSEIFLILKRIERDMIINVYRSSYKVSVILVRF
jgi:hypothetical protein